MRSMSSPQKRGSRTLTLTLVSLFFCFSGHCLAQGTATETVGFSVNVEPLFVVNTSAEGGGNIDLGPAGPGEPPASRVARVSVRSNTGRPYRITQRLEQRLQGDGGSGLEEEPVLFTVTDGADGGRSEVKSPTPLTPDPVTLFTSGPEGESDDFTVVYTVSSRRLIPAGSYRARVIIEEEFR